MNIRLLVFILAIPAWLNIKASDTLVVSSQYLPVNDSVLVITPTDYHPRDSVYPLVYMLHGYGGKFTNLNSFLDLQSYADEYRFIIVCPDGLFDSWYFDSPRKTNMKWETFFFNDLYPLINEKYPVDTVNIFITGLSMGGHGAMYLFLRHSGKFNAAASSSGVLDLNYSALKYSSLSNHLGEYNDSKDVFTKYSAISQLDSIKFTDKQIFTDCGTKDHLLEANNKFNEKCMDYRIQITFMTMPGRHNRRYWVNSFPWHFDFFQRRLTNR